jgi:MurNAc alpha-1-phosphate uridylyltransferase
MRAMILAAGAGKRMGDLTLATPKPLLKVAGQYLIEYSIAALAKSGIEEIVINICHHAELIKQTLGNGQRYGVKLIYSVEETALETGGGICQALSLLGSDPFLVVSADIITDFPLQSLPSTLQQLAHIVLVDNPPYHPRGDFSLNNHQVGMHGSLFTFANVSIINPRLFDDCQPGFFRLGDLLKKAANSGLVTGEHYTGMWFNVGTPDDLIHANQIFNSSNII